MRMRKSERGFTLIELMIVVAIIAVIAGIAIPNLLAARVSANESAAIGALRSISSAQAQVQAGGAIDIDQDGTGGYGVFGVLAGVDPLPVTLVPLNPPSLSAAFGNVDGNGFVSRSGYYFRAFLPDVNGVGLAELAGGGMPAADGNMSEVAWCAYAWPINAGSSGNRVFFINHAGDILNFLNTAGAYTALAGPAFDAAYAPPAGSMMGLSAVTNLGVGNDGNTWTPIQ